MPHISALQSAAPMTIGLLGGSFNPPHAGHVHISHIALKRLGLDYLWWLVSPANPLKDPATLAPFERRLALANAITDHPRILISDIEQRNGLRYTKDTLAYLQQRFPQHRFVWLMGSDNLSQFSDWHGWQEVSHRVPIAVLDRAPYTYAALHTRFTIRYQHRRVPALLLKDASPPAWDMLFIPRHGESATRLRKTLGDEAFLLHNINVV